MNRSMINENETASSKELNPLVGIKGRGIIVLVLVGIFFGLFFLGILHYQNVYDETYIRLTPSPPEKGSNYKVYIPKDLEDCMVELKKMLPLKFVKEIKEQKEFDTIQYHHSLGMWMRNNWGLWQGSRLKEYFKSIGIHHPDDMSGIILRSFRRHLNNKEIGLSAQVKVYQKYQEFITKYMEKLKSKKKADKDGEETSIIGIDVGELLEEFASQLEQNVPINSKEHFILEEVEKGKTNKEKME